MKSRTAGGENCPLARQIPLAIEREATDRKRQAGATTAGFYIRLDVQVDLEISSGAVSAVRLE